MHFENIFLYPLSANLIESDLLADLKLLMTFSRTKKLAIDGIYASKVENGDIPLIVSNDVNTAIIVVIS
jgi:hypothetical protein